MVSCVVRNNAHRNENEVTQAFCRLQLEMKGEATEAQQFRLGCGSQQRTPSLGSQTRIDPSAAIPRTVAVQDVEPFCALSFGSVATQSVPETSAFSNGPNLNFWRSSHSPQVALQRRLDHAGRGTQLRTSSSGRQGSCYCGFCEASE